MTNFIGSSRSDDCEYTDLFHDSYLNESKREHLESCDGCRRVFREYHMIADALLSLPLSAFVRWCSVPQSPTEVLCVYECDEGDFSFETMDASADIPADLASRFENRLIVQDPGLREIGLHELELRKRAVENETHEPTSKNFVLVTGCGDTFKTFDGSPDLESQPRGSWELDLARTPPMQTVTPKESASVLVIMPTFNHANSLGRAIRSVLEQTYLNFQILVVDDGSKDHTVQVLSKWTNDRIHYCRSEDNRGPAAARNRGILEAIKTGAELVAFLDADDEWSPHYLERMVAQIFHSPQVVAGAYCDMWLVDPDSDEIDLYRSSELVAGKVGTGVHMSSLMLTRECLELDLFDVSLIIWEDVEMLTRLAGRYALRHVVAPLVRKFRSVRGVPRRKKGEAIRRIALRMAKDANAFPTSTCSEIESRVKRHLAGQVEEP